MRSWGSPALNPETSAHKTTHLASRRSVKVMKSLLPLRLSSPKPPNTRSPSPVPSQGSSYRPQYSPPTLCPIPLPILPTGADSHRHHVSRPSMKLRSGKYRDTPYFTPRPDIACFNDDEVCLSCPPKGSPCNESCIFQDYTNIHNSVSSSGYSTDNEDCQRGLGFQFWESDPYHDTRKWPRVGSSDLSIKCRGESFETSMFSDEAAYLSNSSPRASIRKPESFPRVPWRHSSTEYDSEEWMSDSSSDSNEDVDELGCATALSLVTPLAPAKPHVVDVSGHPLGIPPRSSSLPGLDAGRKSRMTFRDSTQTAPDSPRKSFNCSWRHGNATLAYGYEPTHHFPGIPGGFDLARTSPPLSPTEDSGWHNPTLPLSFSKQRKHPSDIPKTRSVHVLSGEVDALESSPGPLNSIISNLEDAILSFPSVMLLPDAHCIPAIRSHLYQCSIGVGHNVAATSSYSNQVDWQPQMTIGTRQSEDEDEPNLHRSFSLSTLSTFGTFSASKSQPETNIDAARHELSPAPHFSITNGDRTLQTIFPNSTTFHRAAVYSHILAYIFLTTLTSPKTPPPLSNQSTIFTTTSHALPPKVVQVLGAPPMTARPARVDIRDGYAVYAEGAAGVAMDRIELLLKRTKTCIGWLLSEMEKPNSGSFDPGEWEVTVNALILRALVEVVKGCEQNVAVYV